MGFDFVQSAGLVAGRGGQTIAFDRDTSAWYFNSAGTLTSAASDVARFDYNPSTLSANGVLIEAASTNRLRNVTITGASAGSPGTAPTNWIVTSTGGNITRTIVGTGAENGINYIDIRYQMAAAANAFVTFESTTQIVAASGETWSGSAYVKLISGALTNLALDVSISGRDAVGALTESTEASFTPTTAALRTQRITATRTLNNVGTAFSVAAVRFIASGAADITLRIGTPQLEQKAVATSPILSAGAATTRNQDVATINTLTPWFNASEGTIICEFGSSGNRTDAVFPRVLAFSDGTTNNEILIGLNSATGAILGDARVSGSPVGSTTFAGVTFAANTFYKAAYAYKANDFAGCANGGTVATDTNGALPTVDRLIIGADGSGTNQLSWWIKRISYYPRRLPNAQLQSLTI